MHSSYDLLHLADYQTLAETHSPKGIASLQKQHASVTTYPAWARCGQFVEGLCQVDSRIVHHLPHRIVFFPASKGQLRECSLVAWSILDVNEVLLVRDRVVLGQLKEANESLQQRNPGSKEGRHN